MNGMKQKFLILLMMAFGLVACVLDDESETKWKPKTETWTVIIEPEYVMGYSSWGAYSSIGVQMDAFNEKGERIGRFYSGEIKGFTFEEGYRYKLRIEATTTDPGIMDGPAYDFQLIEVISKEYIGISKEGRREVTMDVQMVLMLTPDPRVLMAEKHLTWACRKSMAPSLRCSANTAGVLTKSTDTSVVCA